MYLFLELLRRLFVVLLYHVTSHARSQLKVLISQRVTQLRLLQLKRSNRMTQQENENIMSCFELLEREQSPVNFAHLVSVAKRNHKYSDDMVKAWCADMQMKGLLKSAYVGSDYFLARVANYQQ